MLSMFGRGKTQESGRAIVRGAAWRPEVRGGETYEFILDVTPDDGVPFRATVQQRARAGAHPKEGDTVHVSFDAKDHAVCIDIDNDPRFALQDKQVGVHFIDRQRAAQLEIDDLMRVGVEAAATLQAVAVSDQLQMTRSQEFAITALVQPPDGEAFPAQFALFLFGPVSKPPVVGEVINVLFDPNNRSMVRNRLMWRQRAATQIAEVRWVVPVECPECGARVDQSTAARVAHPECAFCHAPLPCTPAAQV